MKKKVQYRTRQMNELLFYLESVQGSHVTVSDICSHFKNEGIAVGTTTIYRHLERMVKEGIVAKYVIEGTSSACFEYIGPCEGCRQPASYHCKCESCGRLVHLQCNEVEGLRQHLLEQHNFEMNAMRTVFYGICGNCRESDY